MKRPEECYSQEVVCVYSFDRFHLFACLRLDSRFLENSEESARTHKVDIETMKTHKIGSCFRMCDDNHYN